MVLGSLSRSGRAFSSALLMAGAVACDRSSDGARSVQGATASGGVATGSSGVGGSSSGGRSSGDEAPEGGATGSGGRGELANAARLPANARILLLHHSTGGVIWENGLPEWFTSHNASAGSAYRISDKLFPDESYPAWANYPRDYYHIWVAGADDTGQSTLEELARDHDVILFKHCYPVSDLAPDADADLDPGVSYPQTAARYKAAYDALKTKLRGFPAQRFIVWTGAAKQRGADFTEETANRARGFFQWVMNTWDEPGDNIFVWDFWRLETCWSSAQDEDVCGEEAGLFLLPENASGEGNHHPSAAFGADVAPFLGQRIVDVIEGRGDAGSRTGR